MNCGTRAGAVLIGCMLIAGCASQSTVTKDSGAAPAAAARSEVSTPATVAPKATTPQTTIAAQPVATDTTTSAAAQAEQRQAELDVQSSLAAVYYAFDSFSLDTIARDTLLKDFKLLKGKSVKIEGHCDERGSDEYNMALGEKRAHAVQQYLVTLGVPTDRTSTVSYGKERPADAGHDESAWTRNRRAEIVLLK